MNGRVARQGSLAGRLVTSRFCDPLAATLLGMTRGGGANFPKRHPDRGRPPFRHPDRGRHSRCV